MSGPEWTVETPISEITALLDRLRMVEVAVCFRCYVGNHDGCIVAGLPLRLAVDGDPGGRIECYCIRVDHAYAWEGRPNGRTSPTDLAELDHPGPPPTG